MNVETIPTLMAYPSETEVAILRLPPGGVARVFHPFGVREYRQELDDVEAFAVVPGDKDVIGWGAVPCWHYGLAGIRNGRHELDRLAWHDAAALLDMVPVVYVAYEQIEYFGRPRWVAVDAGIEPLGAEAARLAEQDGAA